MEVVNAYKNKEGGCRKLARRFNISMSTVTLWCRNYEIFGRDAFLENKKQKSWKSETKISAVNEYNSGGVSIQDICKKYKISSQTIFRKWLKVYNSHKKLKSTGIKESKSMTKGRKVTFDEKVEIVQYCIDNDKDYTLTMDKFNISYQQIYLWVHKYEQSGIDGLIDGRGKPKSQSDLSEIDRLKIKTRILESEKKKLEMEINVLKKLQEVERRRR